MFQVNNQEFNYLLKQGRLTKSKIRGGSTYLPYVFTEQGVAMLSSVLRSKKAVKVNISIIRTFVYLRGLIETNSLLAERIRELESKSNEHNQNLKIIYKLINKLMIQEESPKEEIGYKL